MGEEGTAIAISWWESETDSDESDLACGQLSSE